MVLQNIFMYPDSRFWNLLANATNSILILDMYACVILTPKFKQHKFRLT